MAGPDSEIRIPFSFEMLTPRANVPAKPSRFPVVNHPANGWRSHQAAERSDRQGSSLLLLVADRNGPGVPVVLPNGSTVPDDYDTPRLTGLLMAPESDLSEVAEEGRRIGIAYQRALRDPQIGAIGALGGLSASLALDLGHGGRFDYQRSGNMITGYQAHSQFIDISNFNVGLLCQQAGLSVTEMLTIAGKFASVFSGNKGARDSYGLDIRQRHFMEIGFAAGEYGGFPKSSGP